jgi:hypothetical protein
LNIQIDELLRMNAADLITISSPNAASQYDEYIKKGEEQANLFLFQNVR